MSLTTSIDLTKKKCRLVNQINYNILLVNRFTYSLFIVEFDIQYDHSIPGIRLDAPGHAFLPRLLAQRPGPHGVGAVGAEAGGPGVGAGAWGLHLRRPRHRLGLKRFMVAENVQGRPST